MSFSIAFVAPLVTTVYTVQHLRDDCFKTKDWRGSYYCQFLSQI